MTKYSLPVVSVHPSADPNDRQNSPAPPQDSVVAVRSSRVTSVDACSVCEPDSYSRIRAPVQAGSSRPEPKYSTSEVSPSTNPGRSDRPVKPSSTLAAGGPVVAGRPLSRADAAAAALAVAASARSARAANFRSPSSTGSPPALAPEGTTGGRLAGSTAVSGRTSAGIGRAAGAPPCRTWGTGGAARARAASAGAKNGVSSVNTHKGIEIRARLIRRPATNGQTSREGGMVIDVQSRTNV
ncbi:hypothetical protein [Spongiactinospora rosea]|uniref:hypothetical protein n=1 Tax=Spongiactinospora rosea TaxID=2248750 RepID=UPI0011C0589C|nr:hypothetical protein [Spongiactinospora rosea]